MTNDSPTGPVEGDYGNVEGGGYWVMEPDHEKATATLQWVMDEDIVVEPGSVEMEWFPTDHWSDHGETWSCPEDEDAQDYQCPHMQTITVFIGRYPPSPEDAPPDPDPDGLTPDPDPDGPDEEDEDDLAEDLVEETIEP